MARLSKCVELTSCRPVCKGAQVLHHYHAFGLKIASELEIPELHPGSGPADVTVRYTQSDTPALASWDEWLTVAGDRVSVRFHDTQFVIDGGHTIRIEALSGTPPEDVRIWLLGSVMAALLHQRGYMPIHANVVALPSGGVAAFGGDSGAGKSTLAAWFEARGHRVLADDLCAILTEEDRHPVAFEGIPRVKLWSDALAALGRGNEGLRRVTSGVDKFHVPIGKPAGEGSLVPFRLERIYLLDLAEGGAPFRIDRLSGAEAARSVLTNAYRWVLGQMIQGPRAQFDQSVALARHAAVFRLERQWGLDRFEAEAEEIERHMLAPLGEVERG